MEHLAPIHQVSVQRAQPLSIRPLRRNTGVVDQRIEASIQFILNDPNSINRICGVGQVHLHVIFTSSAPGTFFRDRVARTGDDPPAFKIEPAHGCMADTAACTSQKKGLLSLGHDHHSCRLGSPQP